MPLTTTSLDINAILSTASTAVEFGYHSPCFTSNGTNLAEFMPFYEAIQWQPCNQGNTAMGNNMCCQLNPSGPETNVTSADVCLPNGLCQSFSWDEIGWETDTYRKGFCASPNRGDCLDICGNDVHQLMYCSTTWKNTTRWCCGTDNSCCEDEHDESQVTIPLVRNAIVQVAPSMSASKAIASEETVTVPEPTATIPERSTTTAPEQTATRPERTTATAPEQSPADSGISGVPVTALSMLSTKTKVAIGVSATLVGLGLFAGGFVLALQCMRRHKVDSLRGKTADKTDLHAIVTQYGPAQVRYAFPRQDEIYEISPKSPQELDTPIKLGHRDLPRTA